MLSESQLRAFGEWERQSWEQGAAEPYAASFGDLSRGSIAALLDAASVGGNTRVLDVGCGPGFIAQAAALRGARVTGADQSPEMVDLARSIGLDVVVSGVESLPFADAQFDAVVAGYLLNHVPSPEAAVAEMSRILVPGGRLAVTVWDVPDANASTGLIGAVISELGLAGSLPPGPDAYRLSQDDELHNVLANWDDVVIDRPRWSLTTSPGAWFDVMATISPRAKTPLVLAGPDARQQARQTYIQRATDLYGVGNGLVALPAAAVLASARKRND
jgi:SAM-dependent methyltransferase